MMTKPELLNEINRIKEQIRKKKSEMSETEKDLEALEEFSRQCSSRITAFENSITRRKNKLFDLDGMLNTVKMAARYKQKMNDMLSGREYQNAVSQIDSLQSSVSSQKSSTKNKIIRLNDEISYLQTRLQQLQYDYNNYPEEVEPNG